MFSKYSVENSLKHLVLNYFRNIMKLTTMFLLK